MLFNSICTFLTLLFCGLCRTKNLKWKIKIDPKCLWYIYLFQTVFNFFISSWHCHTIVSNLWINIVSVIKIKHAMERHADLTGNQLEARKEKPRFTRMVFLLTAHIGHSYHWFGATILYRITVISLATINQGTIELILFSKASPILS